MGNKAHDITNQKFGRLTVLKRTGDKEKGGNSALWLCECDCGKFKETTVNKLRTGRVVSCGCLKEYKNRNTQLIKDNKSTYESYNNMIQRCYNKSRKDYKNYGGRGIKVCDRWLQGFEYFFDDMGARPKGLSIERINTDGDYEPSNCKWDNSTNQCFNRRTFKNNTTGTTGVYWRKDCKKWRALISKEGKTYQLGHYETYEEAVEARLEAEKELYG